MSQTQVFCGRIIIANQKICKEHCRYSTHFQVKNGKSCLARASQVSPCKQCHARIAKRVFAGKWNCQPIMPEVDNAGILWRRSGIASLSLAWHSTSSTRVYLPKSPHNHHRFPFLWIWSLFETTSSCHLECSVCYSRQSFFCQHVWCLDQSQILQLKLWIPVSLRTTYRGYLHHNRQ